jgi:hypothetical protein
MKIMLPAVDVDTIDKLSRESSPELEQTINAEDWPQMASLPLAPNLWAAARHWIRMPWDDDCPAETDPDYWSNLMQLLRTPIALDAFVLAMAQIYINNVGHSLGLRSAALGEMLEVVQPRLQILGYAESDDNALDTAIDALVGNHVKGWPPHQFDVNLMDPSLNLECLLRMFKDESGCPPKNLAVAHAINRFITTPPIVLKFHRVAPKTKMYMKSKKKL